MTDTEVHRIHTRNGSHIEPPLDEAWSNLEKLRWQAAVVGLTTRVTPRIEPSKYSINGVRQAGYFTILIPGGSSSGPHTYSDAWSWLNGYEAGACEEGRVNATA